MPKFENGDTDLSPSRICFFAGGAREPLLKLLERIYIEIRALECPRCVVSSDVCWIHVRANLHCAKGGKSKENHKNGKGESNGAADLNTGLRRCHPIQEVA